jgi:hypothetical protein
MMVGKVTLGWDSLRVFPLFSCIILPMLLTRIPLIYHRRYTILATLRACHRCWCRFSTRRSNKEHLWLYYIFSYSKNNRRPYSWVYEYWKWTRLLRTAPLPRYVVHRQWVACYRYFDSVCHVQGYSAWTSSDWSGNRILMGGEVFAPFQNGPGTQRAP